MSSKYFIPVFISIITLGLAIFIFREEELHEVQVLDSNIPEVSLNVTNNPMTISSSAFTNNQTIPAKYTCDGEGVNPPLGFADIPANTKSLALIVHDPDAPSGDWDHWLLWNIDPTLNHIDENSVPAGAITGTTDFGNTSYGAPCPPSGSHNYVFKLFALDTVLGLLPAGSTREELEIAMQDHILDSAELVGVYSRN